MKNDKNLLILGSNGFLGKNLSLQLENYDNFKLFNLYGKSDLDLTKDLLLEKYINKNKINYVINCAAFVGGIAFGYDFPADLLSKNSKMALNIYESCKNNKVAFLVNPISNCAYPKNLKLYEENKFWDGPPHESVFEYGFSKKLLVALGNAYFSEYGFSSANIVLSNMYGPYDHFEEKKSHALGAMIKKIMNAKLNNLETVEIWGTGKPIREWLFVEDGANALIKALKLKNGSYFYNVGVNKGISILEMAQIIASVVDWKGRFEFNTSKPDGSMEKRVVGDSFYNIMNWKPEVGLNEGIIKTIDWYKNNILETRLDE